MACEEASEEPCKTDAKQNFCEAGGSMSQNIGGSSVLEDPCHLAVLSPSMDSSLSNNNAQFTAEDSNCKRLIDV